MSTTKTGIEWTDASWNPVRGCSRVSEGCRKCYAEKIAARFSDEGLPFHLFADRDKSGSKWTGKVELIEEALTIPLHWRKPRRIFVNSMSDLFHENLPDEAIDRVFAVMALCPQHTFQVLTKRPERMLYIMTKVIRTEKFWPMPNVWLGVSVEDQKTADERIPLLLQTPAAVRFMSYEPALGPVDLTRLLTSKGECIYVNGTPQRGIDWVICGGESGPGARPMHPDWARSARDQCVAAGVPFFFKQWGDYHPAKVIGTGTTTTKDGQTLQTVNYSLPSYCGPRSGAVEHVGRYGRLDKDNDTAMMRVGKKKAGALLDGREWREFPNRKAARSDQG